MSPNQRPSIIPDAHTIETLHHVQSSSILESRTTTEKEPESTTSLNNEKNEPNKTANRARESSCRVCLKSFKPDDFSKTCYECKYRVCEDCASYSKMVMYCSPSHHILIVYRVSFHRKLWKTLGLDDCRAFDKQWNTSLSHSCIPLQSFITKHRCCHRRWLSACVSFCVYPGQRRGLGELLFCRVCLLHADVCTHTTSIDFSFLPSWTLLPLLNINLFSNENDGHPHELHRILGVVVFVVERCLQEYASLKTLLTPI